MEIYRPPVIHQPAEKCDTYETIARFVNYLPCMFISAFRSDLSREENKERSERLALDIEKSDLTYIRCKGHRTDTDGTELIEDAFCVVNSGYTNKCFGRLASEWCRKFEKKAVLITIPVREQINLRKLLKIAAYVYDGQDQIKDRMEFTDLPFSETDQCFNKAYGKTFNLESSSEIVRTSMEPPATVNGHRMAFIRFQKKYPGLS